LRRNNKLSFFFFSSFLPSKGLLRSPLKQASLPQDFLEYNFLVIFSSSSGNFKKVMVGFDELLYKIKRGMRNDSGR
jgi:hypothetical protein